MTGAHEAVLAHSDLFRITLRGDDNQDLRWHEVLLSTKEVPSDDILESLYKMRIRKSDQVKTVLAMHEPEINQNLSKPSNQKFEDHGEETN